METNWQQVIKVHKANLKRKQYKKWAQEYEDSREHDLYKSVGTPLVKSVVN